MDLISHEDENLAREITLEYLNFLDDSVCFIENFSSWLCRYVNLYIYIIYNELFTFQLDDKLSLSCDKFLMKYDKFLQDTLNFRIN